MKKRLCAALSAALVLPFFLAACAHPQLLDMGESDSQIVEYLGNPDARVEYAARLLRAGRCAGGVVAYA